METSSVSEIWSQTDTVLLFRKSNFTLIKLITSDLPVIIKVLLKSSIIKLKTSIIKLSEKQILIKYDRYRLMVIQRTSHEKILPSFTT